MNYNNPSAATAQYGGIGGGVQSQEARPTHVQGQMQRSQVIVESLESKLKSLFNRLEPLLRPVPPTATENNKQEIRPSLVGHANALSNHNDQLERMDQALSELLDRIEL